VREVLRATCVAVLIATLVSIPAQGSPLRPSGTITQVQTTWLDRAIATVGTTVYPGDTLKTDETGSVRLRGGLAQFYMMSDSEARMEDAANGLRATLVKGTAGFSSGSADTVELTALDVVIRSLNGQPAHGRVSIVGQNELVVTSFKGPFELTLDGDTRAVADGMSYRVELQEDTSKPQAEGNGKEAVRNRKKIVKDAIIVGAALAGVGVGIYVYHELCQSNDTPVQQ
jgi:hypothetical protein